MDFSQNITKFKYPLLVMFVMIHVILLLNTQFTLWPEMVVYPYLLNNYFSLYKDLINPYPPFFILFLSLFTNVFGYNPEPFQVLTLITIIIIDILIFFVSKKLFKKANYSLLAVIIFIFTSTAFGINGIWFDLIQTPFVILSFLFFYQYLKNNKDSSLDKSLSFIILASFIKQQTIWIFLFFVIIFIFRLKNKIFNTILKLKLTLTVSALIVLSTIIYLIQNDVVENFIYWVVYFPIFKASQAPGYILFPNFRQLFILLALLLVFIPSFLIKQERIKTFLAFSPALMAYPRFDYFHLIPMLALISIIFPTNLKLVFKSNLLIKLIFIIAGISLIIFSVRNIQRSWGKSTRFFEPDIISASITLNIITSEKELLYLENGPDQIFPLASRLPVKPWADEFSWYLENTKVQEEVVNSLKSNPPQFIVHKPNTGVEQNELSTYKPEIISRYLDSNYENYFKLSDELWLKKRIGDTNNKDVINVDKVENLKKVSLVNDLQFRIAKAVVVTIILCSTLIFWYKRQNAKT